MTVESERNPEEEKGTARREEEGEGKRGGRGKKGGCRSSDDPLGAGSERSVR